MISARYVLILTLLSGPNARALVTAEMRAAIDAYAAGGARAPAAAKASPTPSEVPPALALRVATLAGLNDADYAAWLLLSAFLDTRSKDIRAAQTLNVYADQNFRASLHPDLRELCCIIKTTPELKAAIQARWAERKRPLPHGLKHNEDLLSVLNSAAANERVPASQK